MHMVEQYKRPLYCAGDNNHNNRCSTWDDHMMDRENVMKALEEKWKRGFQRRQLIKRLPVCIYNASFLERQPLRVFRVGEVVAFEEDIARDDGPVSGIKVGAMVPFTVNKFYARIVCIGAANEEGIQRLTIRTGSGVRSVLSTDLFTFTSGRDASVALSLEHYTSLS